MECFVSAFAPCMLLCFATHGGQLDGLDQRYMNMVPDGRIMIEVQAEHDICTHKLLAPPEPFGGVVMGSGTTNPDADAQVTTVRLPMLRPPRFEPPQEAYKRVTREVWEEGLRELQQERSSE